MWEPSNRFCPEAAIADKEKMTAMSGKNLRIMR